MSKRIKLSQNQTILTTRQAAERCAGEITSMLLQQRQLETELDHLITTSRKSFELRLVPLEKRLGELSDQLRAWSEANPSEFAGKSRSI